MNNYDKNILPELIKVVKYAILWREIKTIHYNTCYSVYKRLIQFGIFKNTYIDLLRKYFKKGQNKKLKYQYTDTTCVSNKYGSTLVSYNGYKKRKCTKISLITDSNGIPINVSINNGKQNDGKILVSHFSDMLIDKQLNDKYKEYMLADGIYYVNEVKNLLTQNKYKYIIPPNKKNTNKFKN